MIKDFVISLTLAWQIQESYLEIGHDCFLLHSS
jgi:hypothetical protein